MKWNVINYVLWRVLHGVWDCGLIKYIFKNRLWKDYLLNDVYGRMNFTLGDEQLKFSKRISSWNGTQIEFGWSQFVFKFIYVEDVVFTNSWLNCCRRGDLKIISSGGLAIAIKKTMQGHALFHLALVARCKSKTAMEILLGDISKSFRRKQFSHEKLNTYVNCIIWSLKNLIVCKNPFYVEQAGAVLLPSTNILLNKLTSPTDIN